MELTIDQALQQGVAAHKEGKLQDAERLYRAILKSQPNHPDANHNLGLLAVAVDKPIEAIPLFKLAVETNPQIEQFWLSYIDALIDVRRFDEAKRVLAEGEKFGVSSEKLGRLKQQFQIASHKDKKNTRQGLTVSEKRKKLADKKKAKKERVQARPLGTTPSQDQINRLLNHYQSGRLADAEELAKSLTKQFPNHPFGWKVLGAVFQQRGKLSESLAPKQKAAELLPKDAEALSNLGNTLQDLGRLDEAQASYKKAIALKPDFAEAHNNLGTAFQALGKLDDAEASCRQAIVLKPDFAEAHNNLGITLQKLGRLDDAESSYREAITLKPDYAEAHSNLGITLKALGRLVEAETSYREAIAMKPDYSEAHYNLANMLQELGRLDDAEASYREAIALKPDYAEAHSNLGATLKKLGRHREGIKQQIFGDGVVSFHLKNGFAVIQE